MLSGSRRPNATAPRTSCCRRWSSCGAWQQGSTEVRPLGTRAPALAAPDPLPWGTGAQCEATSALVVPDAPKKVIGDSALAATESGCAHSRPAPISWAWLLKRSLQSTWGTARTAVRAQDHRSHPQIGGDRADPHAPGAASAGATPGTRWRACQSTWRVGAKGRNPRHPRARVSWRKPPDRGSTVPVPSAQHLRPRGLLRPGLCEASNRALILRVHPHKIPLMDRRSNFCAAEAGRCRPRTLPCKPQLPCEVRPWGGKQRLKFLSSMPPS